jgi:hypothetical protein
MEEEMADSKHQIAHMEQGNAQKTQLIDRLRRTLSDLAGRALQGSLEGTEKA